MSQIEAWDAMEHDGQLPPWKQKPPEKKDHWTGVCSMQLMFWLTVGLSLVAICGGGYLGVEWLGGQKSQDFRLLGVLTTPIVRQICAADGYTNVKIVLPDLCTNWTSPTQVGPDENSIQTTKDLLNR